MFIMDIKFNDSFRSKINYTLTRVFTSKIKDDLFVRVIFSILSQKIVILNRIPNYADSSKVLRNYLIRHWDKPNINRTIDWGTSWHGLTCVEGFRCFSTKDIWNHFMNKRNSRSTSNHFDWEIGVLFEIKLYFRFDSAFNVSKGWCHLAQYWHDDVLELLTFHIVWKILLIDNVLDI